MNNGENLWGAVVQQTVDDVKDIIRRAKRAGFVDLELDDEMIVLENEIEDEWFDICCLMACIDTSAVRSHIAKIKEDSGWDSMIFLSEIPKVPVNSTDKLSIRG